MQIHGGQEVRPEPVAAPFAIDGLVILVTANTQTAYELACSLSASTSRTGDALFLSRGRRLDLAHLEF
jgi:hypothetical protein